MFIGFAIGAILAKDMRNKLPDNIQWIVIAIIPIVIIWLRMKYRDPNKLKQKLMIISLLTFGVAGYTVIIMQMLQKYNIVLFYQYKIVCIVVAIIAFIISIAVAFFSSKIN
ncbi:hypothetical protein rsdtw13_38830 [Clostridium sp. TW13]|uniref:Uncharacterized protein n=1 Tax=Inconstantimicrobium mannanitabidum TaxID=1604901 RepID=A0ACB5RHP3_9CLOT|nr:hypothetical protein rsdtw13_38830 [Clostridium sp. TW13]